MCACGHKKTSSYFTVKTLTPPPPPPATGYRAPGFGAIVPVYRERDWAVPRLVNIDCMYVLSKESLEKVEQDCRV